MRRSATASWRKNWTPQGRRTVGAANGRNPISIVVPCHRVIGNDGKLTGYGGGVANKKNLHALECPHLQIPVHYLLVGSRRTVIANGQPSYNGNFRFNRALSDCRPKRLMMAQDVFFLATLP